MAVEGNSKAYRPAAIPVALLSFCFFYHFLCLFEINLSESTAAILAGLGGKATAVRDLPQTSSTCAAAAIKTLAYICS